MAIRFQLLAAAALFAPFLPLHAGDVSPAVVTTDTTAADLANTAPESTPSNLKTSYEFDGDDSYVGDARSNFGRGSGNISEQRSDAKFLVEPQFNDGPIYRFGLAFQRYSFGLSRSAPLPDSLQSESVVLGMDFMLFNSWLVRVEAQPGFYGDTRAEGFRDFNVPFTIGGSYIASDEIQWILGLEVDINRQFPVYPAVGVHWSLGNNWVLDAVLPTPRLEYDYTKNLTLYLGGDVDDGTYRVAPGLGKPLGYKNLGGGIVEYDEIRVGAGLSWKATKAFTLELEGGYLPFREFDFHRADTHFSNNSGAPYGQFALSAQF